MSKAILTTKVDPNYDDVPEQRYHFPRTYLRQLEAARVTAIEISEIITDAYPLAVHRGGRQSQPCNLLTSDECVLLDGGDV